MFTLALIGRPNVGKSTMFNRMVGKDLAIVDDRPGVTRDWRDAEAQLFDRTIRILDTAGLEDAEAGSLTARMRERTEDALMRADAVLFIVDGVAGIMPADHQFAQLVRKSGKPVFVAVNKGDTKKAQAQAAEAYALGLGDPFLISSAHGEGLSPLYHAILNLLPPEEEPEEEPEDLGPPAWSRDDDMPHDLDGIEGMDDFEFKDPEELAASKRVIKVAIVGRPNAGKSTLVNSIIGEDRLLTGPEAGITRDPIAVDWEWQGRPYQIVDTAGLRRKARITDKLESLSTRETMRIVRLAQIVVLVVDGTLGIDRQDLTIADHVIREGRILVIAINKWDAVDDKAGITNHIRTMLDTVLGQLPGVPAVFISGRNSSRLGTLYKAMDDAYALWNKRVSTGALNRWLGKMESRHPAPLVNGRPNRLRYMTQIKMRPPTFVLWVGRPDDMPDDYQRYLVNGLRDEFGLVGVPIRLSLRSSRNPYVT